MTATDSMIRRYETELDERNAFIQGLVATAEERGGDLTETDLGLINEARARIAKVADQLGPLQEAARIAAESRDRARKIDDLIANARHGATVGPVEYRSAAEYIADMYTSALGGEEATSRLQVFHRTAAHQTTTDNPGLLPEQIVSPILNFVDASRPMVSTIGTTDLGTGSWAYAKVTVHTSVAAQSSGEKTELASQKMTITKTAISPATYGGYVNVSKQDIQRSSPQILDMIITDLAAQYAKVTETQTGTDLLAGATAGTALDATPSADEINAALWAAVATTYTNTQGAGRVFLAVAPGDLGKFAAVFAPVNPTNALSSGFSAADFNSGLMGSISGIPVVMTPGLSTGQALVINTAGVQLFETRYGALQVVEPSVWGVQVGYAGDFKAVVQQTGSIVSIDTVP